MRGDVMRRVVTLAAALLLSGAALGQDGPTGEFSATASIQTPSGTRSMAFDVVVSSPRHPADVLPLKQVLADGGQQALANAIRGGGEGQIRLGALVYPVDLAVAEKSDGGWRYLLITTRPIEAGGSASPDHPFAVFGFDSSDFSSGDGVIYTRAALSIDADGRVHASQGGGPPGSLTDVSRVDQNF
jgi:hypothetical protein